MAASARLFTSVPPISASDFRNSPRAQGVSSSRLLARLVHRALVENPEAKGETAPRGSGRRQGACGEVHRALDGCSMRRVSKSRAQARGITASGYVAHVLRAHLRADPPMPYGEFQELEARGERARRRSAAQWRSSLANSAHRTRKLEASLRENVLRLLPALKQIRDKVQEMLSRAIPSPGRRPVPSKRPFRVTRDSSRRHQSRQLRAQGLAGASTARMGCAYGCPRRRCQGGAGEDLRRRARCRRGAGALRVHRSSR